jgi:hypothetical protein
LDRLQFTFGFGGIVDLFIELRLVEWNLNETS